MTDYLAPLTHEEEAAVVARLPSKEARDILVVRNMRLVSKIAARYLQADLEYEDLISIGTIGLVEATQRFDSSKGKFKTIAALCIEHTLCKYMSYLNRTKRGRGRTTSLYTPVFDGELVDTLVDPSDVLDSVLHKYDLQRAREAYQCLDDKRKLVIYMVCCGMSKREVSRQLQRPYVTVCKQYDSAVYRMRKEFKCN
jgi:RNA polymerase sporulation-specific sigma factor